MFFDTTQRAQYLSAGPSLSEARKERAEKENCVPSQADLSCSSEPIEESRPLFNVILPIDLLRTFIASRRCIPLLSNATMGTEVCPWRYQAQHTEKLWQ